MCLVRMAKPPPLPAAPPRLPDAGVQQAREDEIRRRRTASGRGSTILTGSQGSLQSASTTTNTLLGGSG